MTRPNICGRLLPTFAFGLFFGCAQGRESKNQVAPQTAYVSGGHVQNVTAQNDVIMGSQVRITNNYSSFSREQLEGLLKAREESVETKFKVVGSSTVISQDGKHVTKISLEPIGKTIIPEFTVQVAVNRGTVDDIAIENGMSMQMTSSGENESRSEAFLSLQMMPPNPTKIKIVTSESAELRIRISHLKNQ